MEPSGKPFENSKFIKNDVGSLDFVPTEVSINSKVSPHNLTNILDSFPSKESINQGLKSPITTTFKIVGKVALEKCRPFLEGANKIITGIYKASLIVLGILAHVATVVIGIALAIPAFLVGNIVRLAVGLPEKALEKSGLIKERNVSSAGKAGFIATHIVLIPFHIAINISNIPYYLALGSQPVKADKDKSPFVIDLVQLEERIKHFIQNQKNSSQEI